MTPDCYAYLYISNVCFLSIICFGMLVQSIAVLLHPIAYFRHNLCNPAQLMSASTYQSEMSFKGLEYKNCVVEFMLICFIAFSHAVLTTMQVKLVSANPVDETFAKHLQSAYTVVKFVDFWWVKLANPGQFDGPDCMSFAHFFSV